MLKQSALILERQKMEVMKRRLQKQIRKQMSSSQLPVSDFQTEFLEPESKHKKVIDYEHAESVYVNKPCVENMLN